MRNPAVAIACPGCGAARSGAPLIRDRHGLERCTQVAFTRLAHIGAPINPRSVSAEKQENTGIGPTRALAAVLWKPHPEEARSAVSKDEASDPLPSCFETHRSALAVWQHVRSRRGAMLLSMRARRRCAFWRNEPNCDFGQTNPTIISAKPNQARVCLFGRSDGQPHAVRNDRRLRSIVSGLLFTMGFATRTCRSMTQA
jgi:hypothetical protein